MRTSSSEPEVRTLPTSRPQDVDPVESFVYGELRGEVVRRFRPVDLEAAVRRLIDPAAAHATLHWGRNYLYATEVETGSGPVEVVVKQFRAAGAPARVLLSRRGSRAARGWRAALALTAAGVPTAAPVMMIESTRPSGPSFLVTRRIEGALEARYLFRALLAGTEKETFPEVPAEPLIEEIGRTLRRMHEAGIWHRDVSVGNLLIRPAGEEGRAPAIYLIDLGRSRVGVRLTLWRRTRDLCRLRIFGRHLQGIFLRAYWQTRGGPPRAARLLYRLCFHGFLLKNGLKEALRRPFRGVAAALRPRGAHVHIPAAPAGASRRDRVVWDYLSDQPHQHASRLERLGVRLADGGGHARSMAAAARAAPRVWRRYRKLKGALWSRPVPWRGVGIALRPWPERADDLLRAVEALGVGKVLLRLHPWQEDHAAEEDLARALFERGHELVFALPQNRDLVRDPARWREAVSGLAERFRPFGRHFQVGQAVNRSKWGIWTYQEYLALASEAARILRRGGEVEILGPAVIDFELHATLAILNLEAPDLHFDAVSSLLYVDRRGAPENRQAGFDAVDKAALVRAAAETSRNCSPRSWITEVNWPLWEGPHAPAGRSVAVDEETQADYLARYYLLVLGSGLAERVYWWQLVARGYGLITPERDGTLRRRPSFHALATLRRMLAGATGLGPLPGVESPGRLHRFRTPAGDDLLVGWSAGERVRATLPRAAVEATSRGGEGLAPPAGREVELASSPVYFRLSGDG